MLELIITVLLGLVCIIIGIFNTRGNISMLHSYHRKRVTEENVIPFGRLIGLGMIVIGISIAVGGALMSVATMIESSILTVVGTVIMIAGIVIGSVIAFAAMKKYNGGIF